MAPNTSVALLLEDEPLISMDLEMTLEAAGFQVSTVMSCTDANSWLDTRTPDLVVVDIQLSDGRSTDIAARLVAAKIPFIVHSGDQHSLFTGTPFAHGTWLGKPAAPDDLVEAAMAAIAAKGERKSYGYRPNSDDGSLDRAAAFQEG